MWTLDKPMAFFYAAMEGVACMAILLNLGC